MNETVIMDKAEERRRHLLARVAGNIASGMVDKNSVYQTDHKGIASAAVKIARAILDEVGL